MDNQRLLVWAAFGLMLWFTWQAWRQDYEPQAQPETPAQTAPEATPTTSGDTDTLPELADTGEPASQAADAGPILETPAAGPAASSGSVIHVRTDVLDLEINTRGGTLQKALLLQYPVTKDRPDELVQLLSTAPADYGLIQTGLRSSGDQPEPNHLAEFHSAKDNFEIGDNDELTVSLTWENASGISVVKQYRFHRGSYIIGVTQTVKNSSGADWRGASYTQLQRHSYPQKRTMFQVDTYSFHGPVVYDGKRSNKLKRDDLISDGPYSVTATAGWAAMIQHHFLSAFVPTGSGERRYNVAVRNDVATASAIGPAQTIAPGKVGSFETTLFVGPKLQRQLEQVTPSLKLTVDYGWLTPISKTLFWLLSKIHIVLGNWGLAIILVTAMIKLVFYKLTETSGRSMAKMREIQPRMKALQERYKDDRQQLSQAMMELYKREKVNPAAGCLPILIQMPFFLAFYWVLLESVEMRQAPFALWITDLSARDPYFILPLIMGAAMLFQQRLNPTPADPVQAKVMQVMPVVFTGFFAFFPSGLVLYWVTNTSLSIVQQWRINKVVHAESAKRKSGKKEKRKKGDD